MATHLRKVAFTMYAATDVARARRFYEEVLGLEPGLQGGQGDVQWVEYDLPGGGCLAITNATPVQPGAAFGGTIAFEVDDLDLTIADLTERGVELKGAIIPGPARRMVICEDSEGNGLVLHQHNRP